MSPHTGRPKPQPPANRVVIFPFDSFGSPGTSEGARNLGDATREMLADFQRETVPTRALCWCPHTRLVEAAFDTADEQSLWRSRGQRLSSSQSPAKLHDKLVVPSLYQITGQALPLLLKTKR